MRIQPDQLKQDEVISSTGREGALSTRGVPNENVVIRDLRKDGLMVCDPLSGWHPKFDVTAGPMMALWFLRVIGANGKR